MKKLPDYVKVEKGDRITYSKILHNDPHPTSYPNCVSVVVSEYGATLVPKATVDLCECVESTASEFKEAASKTLELV